MKSTSLRRYAAFGLLLLILVIPALACGSSDGGSTTTSGPSVTVINDSSEAICYLYISLSSEDTWGDDRLGSAEVLGTGDSKTVSLSAGTYDMLATDCDDNEIDSEWEVTVGSSGYTWRVGN